MQEQKKYAKADRIVYIAAESIGLFISIVGSLVTEGTVRMIFSVAFLAFAVCGIVLVFSYIIPKQEYLKKCRKYVLVRTNEVLDEIHPPDREVADVLEVVRQKLKNGSEIQAYSKQAEYLALQNQINPHFLYNTLEAIRTDALLAGKKEIADTTKALARFFRYTISATGELFTVEDELENVRNYFGIQNYRFGNRLSLVIECADTDRQVLECRLPKLTLQPIVENAIVHGIEPKIGGGTVTISFELSEKKLVILVRDDGLGMDYETVNRLNDSLREYGTEEESSGNKKKHRSIALKNVNTRIRLFFGGEYGLQVFSYKDLGSEVIVTLPRSYENSRIAAEENNDHAEE